MFGHMPAFGGFDVDALAHFERISTDDFNLLNDLNTLIITLKAIEVWALLDDVFVLHNTLEDSLIGLKGKAVSQILPDASFFNFTPTVGFSRARFGAYINSGLQVGLDWKMQGDDYFMYTFVSKNDIGDNSSYMVMGMKNHQFSPELSLRGRSKEDFSALGFGLLRPVVSNYMVGITYPDAQNRIVSAFDAFNPDAIGACIGTGSTTKPSWSAIRSRRAGDGLSGNNVAADIANANRVDVDEGRFIYVGSINDRRGVLDGPPRSASRMVADIHFAAWATGVNFNSADLTLVGSKEEQFQEAVRVYLEARGVEGAS